MEAKEFGEYLKDIRKERGLTIRQIETYSGVSNSYLSQLENGKKGIPSPTILKKLSKALKVDYNLLMIKAGHLENNEKIIAEDHELLKVIKEHNLKYKGKVLTSEQKEQVEKMLQILLDKKSTD